MFTYPNEQIGTMRPRTVKLFDQTEGFGPIKNLYRISDPNVHKLGDR